MVTGQAAAMEALVAVVVQECAVTTKRLAAAVEDILVVVVLDAELVPEVVVEVITSGLTYPKV